mmetsp:Transcript_20121/g.39879  ORF Transcript_20121/g.39879 Transcript_20121/m.39879 type:complete len:1200 (+) Transcript_20121:26-3625(+)
MSRVSSRGNELPALHSSVLDQKDFPKTESRQSGRWDDSEGRFEGIASESPVLNSMGYNSRATTVHSKKRMVTIDDIQEKTRSKGKHTRSNTHHFGQGGNSRGSARSRSRKSYIFGGESTSNRNSPVSPKTAERYLLRSREHGMQEIPLKKSPSPTSQSAVYMSLDQNFPFPIATTVGGAKSGCKSARELGPSRVGTTNTLNSSGFLTSRLATAETVLVGDHRPLRPVIPLGSQGRSKRRAREQQYFAMLAAFASASRSGHAGSQTSRTHSARDNGAAWSNKTSANGLNTGGKRLLLEEHIREAPRRAPGFSSSEISIKQPATAIRPSRFYNNAYLATIMDDPLLKKSSKSKRATPKAPTATPKPPTATNAAEDSLGAYKSSNLYVESKINSLVSTSSAEKKQSNAEKALVCLNLVEVAGEKLSPDYKSILGSIVACLQDLIFDPNATVLRSSSIYMEPAEDLMDRRIKQEKLAEKQEINRMEADRLKKKLGRTKSSIEGANNEASAEEQQTQVVPSKPSNIIYDCVPYFERAPTMITEYIQKLSENHLLRKRIQKKKRILDRANQQRDYLKSWDAKCELQLALLTQSEHEMKNELSMLQQAIQDGSDEREAITQENITLKDQGAVTEGLVWGGQYAIEYNQENTEKDLEQQIVNVRQQLDDAMVKRTKVKTQLSTIFHDRDLLLTRVEVLEQAVRMTHGYLEESMAMRYGKKHVEEDPREWLNILEGSEHLDEDRDPKQWLRGRGLGQDVPIFLRHVGWVKNTQMSKVEVEMRIKEIWSLKSLGDQVSNQTGDPILTLPVYFEQYLQDRFSTNKRAMIEFSHNFVHALERHVNDPDFALFLRVLFEDVHEDHFYDQMMMMANLKTMFVQLSDSEADGNRNLISLQTFHNAIRRFFPAKRDDFFQELWAIVFRECMSNGFVDLNKILEEDSSGFQSNFIECVRDQYILELDQVTAELYSSLVDTLYTHQMEKDRRMEAKQIGVGARKVVQTKEPEKETVEPEKETPKEDTEVKVEESTKEKAKETKEERKARKAREKQDKKDKKKKERKAEKEIKAEEKKAQEKKEPYFKRGDIKALQGVEVSEIITDPHLLASRLETVKFVGKPDPLKESTLTSYEMVCSDLESCLRKVDPKMPDSEVRNLLVRGSADYFYSYDTKVDANTFIVRLKTEGLMCRTGHWTRIFYDVEDHEPDMQGNYEES